MPRIYSYAYRLHTIGAFHATRQALQARPLSNALAEAHRERAIELMTDLANQGMTLLEMIFAPWLPRFIATIAISGE